MGILKDQHHSLFLLLNIINVLASFSVQSAEPPFSCASIPSKNYNFCNAKLSIQQRVDDLISKLTLDEKISQLGDIAPAIPRLGIPAYKWWSESLHGVSNSGKGIYFNGTIRSATSFPQVILSAASFNPNLWYLIGQVIGTEARAIYNAGQAEGLTFWAPNINVFRDPRWGRGQETPGEDPETVSRYAVSYVRGMQGDSFNNKKGGVTASSSSTGLKVSACCKHYTAYDLDNWEKVVRYTFDAKVTAQDLVDTYQPPFQSCVQEGHASGMMCSYNRVNGVPTCADYNLLSKTARASWGFYGYIVSDCDAVSIIHDAQGYAKAPEDAVADVLQAGMDVNCGNYMQKYAGSAIQQKKITESDINRALQNLFTIRMRLGLFDGSPKNQAYGNIPPTQVCTQDHQNLALEAAREGIVLLKNSNNLLPLSKAKVASLGVIGPNANNFTTLLGNYAGPPCKSISPLQALQSYVKDTKYVPGCSSVACPSSSTSEAVQLASSVDYVIMVMGLDLTQEKEELDRENLVLPGMQESLITSVAKAAKKPVILVLMCGGPVDVTFAKLDDKIGAILWVGYPGEAGGLAMAEILFGEHNPGGRLPVTWYPQEFTKVPMTDMRMRADPATGYPGRTYRFYTGTPVFKFGFGLSYSKFSYEFVSVATEGSVYLNKSVNLYDLKKTSGNSYDTMKIGSKACKNLKFSAVVGVKNHGPMAGRHPVMLFKRSSTLQGRPMEQLIRFKSVQLDAGEEAKVEFIMNPCKHLGRTEVDGAKVLDEGSHILVVGEKEYELSIIA
ncbi:Xylan 1,4-beta-xylosidase protein [Dioscorea alata]|uniref:Xylan 1,4-beta-xylosidase protein n=1 Tax=Dioscorea alata TaxID=55571 RepID=A0ACB7W7C9_DIOAL|nr:Xylan 1,4-beta-xylosidase protein [Dioscorea alata]